MRAALLLAALLLTVTVAPGATALVNGGCDGVVLDGQLTGHCGDACNGDVFVRDAWVASHRCAPVLCPFLCGFP